MSTLARANWPWELLAFVLGAVITWLLLSRRESAPGGPVVEEHSEEREQDRVLVTAGGAPVEQEPAVERQPVFSQRMDEAKASAPTLFDDITSDELPGKYGPGSADAVEHQGPPDGFTIKGNGQSMLFHTPDSPYYGRTKPEVWFRTEADAERAGFTKYTRKPRKSPRSPD